MRIYEHIVRADEGMHARPAGLFVKLASRCVSSIEVQKDGRAVNVKRILAVMGMCIRKGDSIIFRVDGADEEAIVREVEEICQNTL